AGPSADGGVGSMAVGTQSTVDVLVAPVSPGTPTDTADVSAATGDPDPSNNADSEQTTAQGDACTLVGTWGPDTLPGSSADDVLCGLGGDDTLSGDGGDD